MQENDLKVVWICDRCRDIFLFQNDCERHCQKTGHSRLSAFDLDTGQLLKRKSLRLNPRYCLQA